MRSKLHLPASTRVFLASATAVVALTAACSSSGSGNSPSSRSPATSPATSPTTSASSAVVAASGGVLVAPDGRTLYEFSKDTATSTGCTGSCTGIWPPLTGTPQAGSGVQGDKLGTLVRADGTRQVTYAGHPLYEYTGDQTAGERNGEGVSDNGGIWHVASSSGVQPTSASSASMSSSSSGYGY